MTTGSASDWFTLTLLFIIIFQLGGIALVIFTMSNAICEAIDLLRKAYEQSARRDP